MNVIIQRGKVVKLEDLPEFSIAIDGAVLGPAIDPEHHRYSFDHHSGCIRFCTTSSCQQAYTAVLLGLEPESYNVYVNDIDLDSVLSVWCLQNPDRCKEPLVKKLVDAVGAADCHGGAFPVNGMSKTIEWVDAPTTDSKRNDDYHKLSDSGLNSLMEAVLHRIDLYANGEAQIEVIKQPKHGEYKILRNENGWVLVQSSDPHAFSAIYQAGFDRIVLTRPQSDGTLAVTLAKKSDFVQGFNLVKMYEEFNKIEPGAGGSSSIGGLVRHPDGSRSKLSLEQIIEIVDKVVLNK